MVELAPRYDRRILEAIRALDDADEPMAEISRRVGRVAAAYGLPKPSYVHVRRYILEFREQVGYERRRRQEIREILWGIYWDLTYSKRLDPWEIEARIRAAGG